MAFNKNCLKKVYRESKCFICGKKPDIKLKDNWLCGDCYDQCLCSKEEKSLKNKQKDK